MKRRRVTGLVVAVTFVLLAAGCSPAGSESAGAVEDDAPCPEPTPPSLLDGGPRGEPSRARTDQGLLAITWGDPPHHVITFVGKDAEKVAGGAQEFATESWPRSGQQVDTPRGPRLVRPVGDPGVSQIQILLTRDGCRYVVMLPVGISLEDAIRYARGL